MGWPHHAQAQQREHDPDHAVSGDAHRTALVLPALEPRRTPLWLAGAGLVIPGTDRSDAFTLPARSARLGVAFLIVFLEAFINVLGQALQVAIIVRVLLSSLPV